MYKSSYIGGNRRVIITSILEKSKKFQILQNCYVFFKSTFFFNP